MNRDYRDVALVTPTTFGYARRSPFPAAWFIAGTLAEMLRKSGLAKNSIDGLVIASYRNAPDNAASLTQHLGISPRYLVDLPYGGASGVMGLRRAARAIQAGDAEVVACIAADVPPAANDTGANFSNASRDAVYPYGAGGPNAVFSLITQAYARENRVRREDFGTICTAQRKNAQHFAAALLRGPMSMADYLAARMVTDVLGLYDCVMRCCGAEGVLVMAADRARSLGLPYAVIGAAVERHNSHPDDDVQQAIGLAADREALFSAAGLAPQDMDFVQAYDDYPVIVMLQLESLGFCAQGEAARFVAAHDLTFAGDFPLNTCGGMLSMGQAGAAGGFVGVTEAVRQLTGLATENRVEGARAGLVSCYGTVNYDRGVCWSAAILQSG
jgi:acetyl-CoA acetyltransferase